MGTPVHFMCAISYMARECCACVWSVCVQRGPWHNRATCVFSVTRPTKKEENESKKNAPSPRVSQVPRPTRPECREDEDDALAFYFLRKEFRSPFLLVRAGFKHLRGIV